jgi:nucleotide-binding universal stress UspA family protein
MKSIKNKIRKSSETRTTPGRAARVQASATSAPRLAIQSILVPIDFSPESLKALDYAIPFARQLGAKITVLHVVEPVATPDFAYYPLMMENDKIIAAAKHRLEQLTASGKVDASLVERTLVHNGAAFHEITKAAETLKADLIVIATHGYTGLSHVLLGSTAERVVRHARCPVLVVRARK